MPPFNHDTQFKRVFEPTVTLPIKTQGKRIQQQPVAPPPAMIVLEMREEVAETLAIILRHIGGTPSGRRGHAEELSAALRSAGISYHHFYNSPDVERCGTSSPGIFFKPTVTRP